MVDIAYGIHPHQEEILALRQHVDMDLLRTLGHEQEVEAELAPLTVPELAGCKTCFV